MGDFTQPCKFFQRLLLLHHVLSKFPSFEFLNPWKFLLSLIFKMLQDHKNKVLLHLEKDKKTKTNGTNGKEIKKIEQLANKNILK